MKIFTREEFKKVVFERDNFLCVICGSEAKDAHHIIDRKLFKDGSQGYFLDNGSSLCHSCHYKAETTELSVEEIRNKSGIKNIILPYQFDSTESYDKWGNIIKDGILYPGEFFWNEEVQKIIKIKKMSNKIKYPRSWHFFDSVGTSDDKTMKDDLHFHGKQVICSIKCDGENTTCGKDYIHARSLDSNNHPSRNWVKGFHAQFKHLLDDNIRVCGENMYALHTVPYENLESYFLGFSVWENNTCLSWEDTLDWFYILGITSVPVIYEGIYDLKLIKEKFQEYDSKIVSEGFVVRLKESFEMKDFSTSLNKFVKPEFMSQMKENDTHWMSKAIIKNKLKEN